jgi:pimeloyl-ACP methyl ester carboxylesterase
VGELKRKMIVIDGVRVSYLERESNAPPLILLHGFASGSYIWKGLSYKMDGAFRVLVPDLPGHGLSGLPATEPTLDYYVQLLEQFRLAVNVDRFNAVGHSMGAAIMASYSLTHSQRLNGLILESPPDDRSRQPLFWKIIAIPILGDFIINFYPPTRWILRKRLERGLYEPSHLTEEIVEEAWIAFKNGLIRNWIPRALRIPSSPIAWGKIPLFCKIAYGNQDRLVSPAFLNRLRESIPSADFHAFENCGHIPHLEHPEEFAALLADV